MTHNCVDVCQIADHNPSLQNVIKRGFRARNVTSFAPMDYYRFFGNNITRFDLENANLHNEF